MGGTIDLVRNFGANQEDLGVITPKGTKSVALLLAEEVRKQLGIKSGAKVERTMGQGDIGLKMTLPLKGKTLRVDGHEYSNVEVEFSIFAVHTGDVRESKSRVEAVEFVSNSKKERRDIARWVRSAEPERTVFSF